MANTLSDRRRNEAGEIDYRCPAGHHVFGANVLYKTNGKGKSTPSCRECKRIYRANHRKKNSTQAAERLRYERRKNSGPAAYDSKGNAIPLEEYLGTEKRSAPWNLLRPSADASSSFDEFHEALKYTDVPCRGKWDEFTEYQDPRVAFVDENEGRPPMPGRERAKLMCAGCKLFDLCGSYAKADKPDIGVWSGERWLAGKVI